MKNTVDRAIATVWNYLQIHEQPGSADALVILGSRDDRVAQYGAELAERFAYGAIVVSGGSAHHNDLLATKWLEATEAEHFGVIMHRAGVSQPILLEKQAVNTGENARFSARLLQGRGEMPRTILLVTKPYMERRAVATFQAQWPDRDVELHVSSPRLAFEDYVTDQQPADVVVNSMVGDLQRIMEYPAHGWQSRQPVSAAVRVAYETLLRAGYTKHLVS